MNPLVKICIVLTAMVAIGLGVSHEAKASQTASWEYRFVWIDLKPDGSVGGWFEDATKRLPLPVNAVTKAQELGAQGWELVNVVTFAQSAQAKWGSVSGGGIAFNPYSSAVQYVFKRQK
jgi:hypothetical protein